MNRARKWMILISLIACNSSTVAASSGEIALVDGKVYASPNAAPIEHAVVLIHNQSIDAVGDRNSLKVPAGAQVINCVGKVITAGFWNSHVHLTEDAWDDAAHAPAANLEAHMKEMLTRWGFTMVFDIASFPGNTLALRKRVESGEIPGPKIYTTAGEIYPKGGIPVYLPEKIARQLTSQEATTPEDAARLAQQEMDLGGDGVKVFAGAIIHGRVLPMDVSLIKAAVEVAHAHGKPVFAHPSNHVGTDNALAGGVDVLAHLIPMESDWTVTSYRR
jgi:imidazolonepropionase-like amidohydrolase